MPQTFDIRFARSDGLAALLEAPENTFRWKGAGSLRIDAQGFSIAVRRSLLSLFARNRTRRIDAAQLKEVYREGEALRVEFASDTIERGRLRFWARDSATAAQIVRLLPTLRTVEMEQNTDAHSPDRSDRNGRFAILWTAMVVLGCAALLLRFGRSPAVSPAPVVAAKSQGAEQTGSPETPASAGQAGQSAATPVFSASLPATSRDSAPRLVDYPLFPDTTTPAAGTAIVETPSAESARTAPASAPSTASADSEAGDFVPYVPTIHFSPEDLVIPIPQKTLAYDKARRLLESFEAGASRLTEDYRHDRELADSGQINSKQFADKLDEIARLWAVLAERTPFANEFKESELIGIRSTLRAVVRYQLNFLEGYALGLRTGDAAAVDKAFEELGHAEEMLVRARLYVR